jgi:hypothetical protein
MTYSKDSTTHSSLTDAEKFLKKKSERLEYDNVPGYWEEVHENGWVSVFYHYTSHPDKRDDVWAKSMSASYPGGMEGAAWKAEMEVDFGARSGQLVYPAWDRSVHVIEPFELDPYWPRFRSIDPGWHNPTACLWGCLSPDGIMYFYKEHYGSGSTVSEHAQAIKGLSGRDVYEWTVIDPSASAKTLASQKSVLMQFQEHGILCIPGDNRLEDGISELNEWYRIKDDGYPNIQVFSTLQNFIDEIEHYRYEILTPEQAGRRDPRERPIPKGDHLMDCKRYLIMSAPEYSKGARATGYAKMTWAERVKKQIRKHALATEDPDDLSRPM